MSRVDYYPSVSHYELDLVVDAISASTALHLALFLIRAGTVEELEQFSAGQKIEEKKEFGSTTSLKKFSRFSRCIGSEPSLRQVLHVTIQIERAGESLIVSYHEHSTSGVGLKQLRLGLFLECRWPERLPLRDETIACSVKNRK